MGSGIGQVSLMAGFNVTLVDIKNEFIEKGWNNIKNGMKKLEENGKLDKTLTVDDFMAKCQKSVNIASAISDADIMVEAVVEKLDAKQQVFKTCGENAPSHCLLATNTSTMSITDIGKHSGRPDKVIGMHFFNPVPLMRLVEIIYGEHSSKESISIGSDFARKLPCLRGERYIAEVLKDRPGFIVNRLNAPVSIYRNYLLDLCAEKGISWDQLDADYEGKVPMLPGVLADYVGIDTSYYGALYYAEQLSPDFTPGKVITNMVKNGKLGKKTGQGFYNWSKGRPNPDTSKKAELVDFNLILAIKLNEGCRLLEEGVVKSYKVIDNANMAGRNTPGPFAICKDNYEKYVKKLEQFVQKTGKTYLNPCEFLKTGKFLEMD
jgi:enoyl-CoA hydratase/3-hydroxyacyl-CoA dehydrogenase